MTCSTVSIVSTATRAVLASGHSIRRRRRSLRPRDEPAVRHRQRSRALRRHGRTLRDAARSSSVGCGRTPALAARARGRLAVSSRRRAIDRGGDGLDPALAGRRPPDRMPGAIAQRLPPARALFLDLTPAHIPGSGRRSIAFLVPSPPGSASPTAPASARSTSRSTVRCRGPTSSAAAPPACTSAAASTGSPWLKPRFGAVNILNGRSCWRHRTASSTTPAPPPASIPSGRTATSPTARPRRGRPYRSPD